MSEEHKALGWVDSEHHSFSLGFSSFICFFSYHPPLGFLAVDAQSAAAKHPEGKGTIDPEILVQAALQDAARIS